MKKPKRSAELTRDEQALLLYFDSRAVDHRGKIDGRHLNDDDRKIVLRWMESGFIQFGRIASDFGGGEWVKLSDEAWGMIAATRKARAERMWKERSWMTTAEKKAANR